MLIIFITLNKRLKDFTLQKTGRKLFDIYSGLDSNILYFVNHSLDLRNTQFDDY